MLERLDVAVARLRSDLDRLDPGALTRAPLETAMRAVDAGPPRPGYAHVDASLAALLDGMGDRGSPVSAGYHQLLLLSLIRARGASFAAAPTLTEAVKVWIARNHARILTDVVEQRQPPGFWHRRSDGYLKDLGVCSGRILPAGAQKLNRTNLPVGGLRRERPARLARAALCVARLGGLGPVFDMHTDSHDADLMAEFNPDGWRRFYRNVADLLVVQPDVRGLYGIGWFFDPQLATVSPRLDYLRDLVAESGGHLFRIGPNEGARTSALATSPTRRELHAAGRYEPTDYMALWDRRALLRWARAAST